jgi:hypothetical protein
MLELPGQWRVKFRNWTWEYTLTADGRSTWRDPLNGMTGSGRWAKAPKVVFFTWANSKTKESWNLPVSNRMVGRIDASYGGGAAQVERMTGASPTPAPAEWSGDSSQWPEEKKLKSLDPQFRSKVVIVLAKLRDRAFKPKIVFAWRSVQVQEQLVRMGRSKVRFSFHNAQKPDGTPNAYAADVVDERWGWGPKAEANGFWHALGDEAKVLGLVWGGDWTTFKDVAHIQGRRNSELAAVKRESGL